MSFELNKEARLALKKQAHHLKPIVQSGAAGLSEPVLAEIDRALTDHELVKIKLVAEDKASFKIEVDTVCEKLDAQSVQEIGRTATLYRPNPDKPTTIAEPDKPPRANTSTRGKPQHKSKAKPAPRPRRK